MERPGEIQADALSALPKNLQIVYKILGAKIIGQAALTNKNHLTGNHVRLKMN